MSDVKILCFDKKYYENAKILSQRSEFKFVQGNYEPIDKDLLIIYGAHNATIELIKLVQSFKNIILIIIQGEQLESEIFENKYYISLLKYHNCYVFEWSEYNSTKLKSLYKINPISIYSYDFYGKEPYPKIEDREYDICFIGNRNLRIQKIINEMITTYSDYKYFIDLENKLDEPSKINEVLKKSKIVLNLNNNVNDVLNTHKIINAKSCGCIVLSEFSNCDDLNKCYEPFIHFTNNIIKSLKDINELIENPKKSHKEWNDIINKNTIADNIEQLKKIISLHYIKEDEKK